MTTARRTSGHRPKDVRKLALAALLVALAAGVVAHGEAAGGDGWHPDALYVHDLNAPAIDVSGLDPTFLSWSAPVLVCESSGIADNVNKRSGATGLLQLMPIHQNRAAGLGFSWDDMKRPLPNLAVAQSIWLEQGASPWTESAGCVRRLLGEGGPMIRPPY